MQSGVLGDDSWVWKYKVTMKERDILNVFCTAKYLDIDKVFI
jgi:hypothetical protein